MRRIPTLTALLLSTVLPFITIAQPAPFEKEIAAFEASDAKSPPPQGAVLFLGSSSIRLWKTLAEDFPDLKTINRGFGGSHVEHSVRYADKIVLPYRPKLIVLYAGDNDIAAGKSPQRVLQDFQALVTKVHAELPDTPILFIAIKPSVARWHLHGRIWLANRLVREFAESHPKVDFADVYTPALDPEGRPRADLLVDDGLHLNEQGYRLWTKVIRPHVARALAGEERGH